MAGPDMRVYWRLLDCYKLVDFDPSLEFIQSTEFSTRRLNLTEVRLVTVDNRRNLQEVERAFRFISERVNRVAQADVAHLGIFSRTRLTLLPALQPSTCPRGFRTLSGWLFRF